MFSLVLASALMEWPVDQTTTVSSFLLALNIIFLFVMEGKQFCGPIPSPCLTNIDILTAEAFVWFILYYTHCTVT